MMPLSAVVGMEKLQIKERWCKKK